MCGFCHRIVTLDVFQENRVQKMSVGRVRPSTCLDARPQRLSAGGRPLHPAVGSSRRLGGRPGFTNGFAMVLCPADGSLIATLTVGRSGRLHPDRRT
jgi:hypothetical protein